MPSKYFIRHSSRFKPSPDFFEQYRQLRDKPNTRKSHLIEGRYENIYLKAEDFPMLAAILEEANTFAAEILNMDEPLAAGHWFNEMQPDNRTLPHTHDENEELLSGVFYCSAPECSGDLLLGEGDGVVRIQPEVGKFVFFSPALVHEVEQNQSDEMRLSLGMNFFTLESFRAIQLLENEHVQTLSIDLPAIKDLEALS